MKKSTVALFCLFCTLSGPALAQTTTLDLPNSFTNSITPYPYGCIVGTPSQFAVSDLLFYNETLTVTEGSDEADIQIRAWRIGCHEPDRSVVVVNLNYLDGSRNVRYPNAQLFVRNQTIFSEASLDVLPSVNAYNPSGQSGSAAIWNFPPDSFADGVTFIVSPTSGISEEDYNNELTLRLNWTDNQTVAFIIPEYVAFLDSPQVEEPPIHGRYSGQWIATNLPSTGLVLQVGEVPGTTRNFVFAIWFTYLNEEPIWLVANKDIEIGSSRIELDLVLLQGGQILTQPGQFDQNDISVTPAGTMNLSANHCNSMSVDVNLSPIGAGTQTLDLERLIRIAGYDCDHTQ